MRPVAALLPWQLLLLAYAAGIWMVREPWAGLTVLALIAVCNRLAGRVTPRPAFLALAAVIGLAWTWARLPDIPQDPAWLDQRPKGTLSGTVDDTDDKPGGRLEILLDDPEFRFADGRTVALPGDLVWTWQDPAFRPSPGSRVRLAARPSSTVGFDNPGGSDWAWRWRLQGVFYRAYTLGNKAGAKPGAAGAAPKMDGREDARGEPRSVEVEEEVPLTRAEAWRLSLRQAMLDGAAGKGGRLFGDASPVAPGVRPGGKPDGEPGDPGDMPGGKARGASGGNAHSRGTLHGDPADPPRSDAFGQPDPRADGKPGSPAGMVLGLITGERFAIERADLDLVRRASLSHLLAVSGMNLAAVLTMGWCLAALAGLAWPGLYLRIPRPKLAVLIGIPLTLCYLWLARFEPSLVRAALMFGCWGTLLLFNRSRILIDGLFGALGLMLLWNPLDAFSVGLQLSAAAVAGLVMLTPLGAPLLDRLRRLGRWGRPLYILAGAALVTLCAQVAVMPIQAQVFGEASWNMYLNLLWVPVVDWLAQPPAYVGALTVLWLPKVGAPLLCASATVCNWMLLSLRAMDHAGFLQIYPIRRPLWPEFLGYLLLAGGLAYAFRLPARRRLVWLGMCLVLLGGPSLARVWEDGRERVSLTMLDVGQGQALLLETPGGRRYLVDGGGTSGDFDIGHAVIAPILTWGRRPVMEGLIMSHPDRDHAKGLNYPLAHFRVGFLAGNGEWPANDEYRNALAASGLTPQIWRSDRNASAGGEGEPLPVGQLVRLGDGLDLGDGLRLEVLHPPQGYAGKGNEASLILRLAWRGHGLAILPGDAGKDALATVMASGRDVAADVLVMPHHGSKSALSPAFYDHVGAGLALISTGRGNSFGLPSPVVTEALAARGVAMRDTATSGAVTVRWDGPHGRPEITTRR